MAKSINTNFQNQLAVLLRKGKLDHDGTHYRFTPKPEYKAAFGDTAHFVSLTLSRVVDMAYRDMAANFIQS